VPSACISEGIELTYIEPMGTVSGESKHNRLPYVRDRSDFY